MDRNRYCMLIIKHIWVCIDWINFVRKQKMLQNINEIISMWKNKIYVEKKIGLLKYEKNNYKWYDMLL